MRKRIFSEKGASLVSYVMIVALVAVIGVPSIKSLGFKVGEKFCLAGSYVEQAGNVQNYISGLHSFNGANCSNSMVVSVIPTIIVGGLPGTPRE